MKILSKNIGNVSFIERYNLDELYTEHSLAKGLIICYLLSKNIEVKFLSLTMKAAHEEIGVPLKWKYTHNQKSFSKSVTSLDAFLQINDVEDFGDWTLIVEYLGTEVTISGNRYDAEIGISYSKKKSVNVLPLLSNIESQSYFYNSFDKKVFDILINEYKLSAKRAVLSLQKLQAHKDIYEEFLSAIKGCVLKNPLIVEGFTAEKLKAEYPLSLLGAYNYIIYLRNSPKEALEDLKNGLTRK